MSFQIHALPEAPFKELFSLDETALTRRRACLMRADSKPGFPCRVSLADAEPGERVVLVNYQHLPVESPYRSEHAIFVREHALQAQPDVGEIPAVIASRLISVRAFDACHFMRDAEVEEGAKLSPLLKRMLSDDQVAYLHLHNARPGCYAARVTRA